MKVRTACLTALAILAACNRYEWKDDRKVPGLCGSPRTTRAPTPPRDREVMLVGSHLIGRVVRRDSDTAVTYADVQLGPEPYRRTRTDANGMFAFDSVPPSRMTLRVRQIGFAAWQETIATIETPAPELVVALRLQPTDGPCSGFAWVRVRKPWWKFW